MSGHSKWSTIKRKKEKTDADRAKIFTKIGRELAVAVKNGGPDPATNNRLRDCILKAKSNNVPNDNIERIIKKAAGGEEGTKFENITYEGYGPGGAAIIVEALTENRNRTAGNIRHYFDKYGGNLGQPGCVSYLFSQKGVLVFENEEINPEKVEEDAINSGALDFKFEDDCFIIYTEKGDFENVRNFFEKEGYKFISSEIEMIPVSFINLSLEDVEKAQILVDVLEEDEDVQNVWKNYEEKIFKK